MSDIDMLLSDVYAKRMNGGPLAPAQVAAVTAWLRAIPAPPVVTGDGDSRSRGKILFEGKGGCTACHFGPKLTDNNWHTVGNSSAFQTPALVGVGWRAPFLHDGCASKLFDRFDPKCRAPSHGNTSGMVSSEISDLAAYLDSL
jgi:hypothetical protein